MPERVEHYEAYLQKFDFITFPGLVDEGYGRDAIVSSKFRANYTTIVTVDLDGEIAYRKDFPNNFSGAYSGLDSKIGDLLDDIDSEPPDVEVTSPSGGEELQVGASHDIEWTADDNVGVVSRAIYLTTDGSTYELVDSADDNTGTFAWTVPDESSNNCKIKVYAYDEMGNTGNGESNVFSIGGTGIINNLTKAKELMTIRKNPGSYSVYNPFSGSYDVTITDVQGKQLASFTTNGRGWYTIPVSISSGMHFVSIRTPEKTIVSKIWFVR